MEKDLYAQILDEFPSEAIIQIFSFIEYIEEAIVTYFGNIINKIKEKKVKEETNENEEKEGKIHIEIDLKENRKKHYINHIDLYLGDNYINPIEPFLPKDILNDDFFFCFEIVCVNEEVAKNCIETINLETLPKLNYFPYYISFSEINGHIKFFRINNKIIICLSRKSDFLNKLSELINDLNYEKKFGIKCKMDFTCAYDIFNINFLNIEDFFDKYSSQKVIFDFQIKNFKNIFLMLINYLEDFNISSLIYFLQFFLSVRNINFIFDYNIQIQDVNDFVDKIMPGFFPVFLSLLYKEMKESKIKQDVFLNILNCLCSKIGLNFNKPDFESCNFYLFFPKFKIFSQFRKITEF